GAPLASRPRLRSRFVTAGPAGTAMPVPRPGLAASAAASTALQILRRRGRHSGVGALSDGERIVPATSALLASGPVAAARRNTVVQTLTRRRPIARHAREETVGSIRPIAPGLAVSRPMSA